MKKNLVFLVLEKNNSGISIALLKLKIEQPEKRFAIGRIEKNFASILFSHLRVKRYVGEPCFGKFNIKYILKLNF